MSVGPVLEGANLALLMYFDDVRDRVELYMIFNKKSESGVKTIVVKNWLLCIILLVIISCRVL